MVHNYGIILIGPDEDDIFEFMIINVKLIIVEMGFFFLLTTGLCMYL